MSVPEGERHGAFLFPTTMNTLLTTSTLNNYLDSKELRLVPISHDIEAARYQAVLNNIDALSQHFTWCPTTFNRNNNDRQIASRIIRHNRGLAYYFVLVNAEEEVVGEIGIDSIFQRQRTGNVFYWICRSHRRKGWATLALKSLANLAKTLPQIDHLLIRMQVDNTGSQKAAKNAGAVYQKTQWGFVRASSKHCLLHAYKLDLR